MGQNVQNTPQAKLSTIIIGFEFSFNDKFFFLYGNVKIIQKRYGLKLASIKCLIIIIIIIMK